MGHCKTQIQTQQTQTQKCLYQFQAGGQNNLKGSPTLTQS